MSVNQKTPQNNMGEMRRRAGLTQKQAAEAADIPLGTLRRWEQGQNDPDMGSLMRLAELYHTTLDSMLVTDRVLPANAIPVCGTSAMVPVRVLGRTHAGDRMDELESDYEAEFPEGVVSRHPGCFALKVEGDCMNRRYPKGCHVLVDPDIEPSNGRAVVAEFEDGRSVLRCYYRGQSSLMLTADSFSEYEDIILTGDDPVRLIGVVVWFQAEKEEGE